MLIILTTIFFIFGLIIGSFLNVVIIRFNTQKSFGGRSGCMSCQNKLTWYELIPVFSFLGLRGRCKNCKTKISFQYPLVELITGLIFALLFLKFQDLFFLNTLNFIFTYAYYAVVFSLFLVIAIYDLKHKIIPDILSLVLGILAFMGLFFFTNYEFSPHIPTLLGFLAGPIIAAPFAFIWLVSSGKWMGLGDAKLVISLGWLLGLSNALSGLVFAFWIGSIVGLSLVIFSNKKHGMKSEIPFAPYLVLGASLVFLFGLYLF
jgi:prepilin signal peptidase PulO-like enzyme (type II secretory pathway)